MMMTSHVLLHIKSPKLHRPYQTPGGIITSATALGFAFIAFTSTFLINPLATLFAGAFYLVMMIYFGCFSRHHLVASAPEEAFAALLRATDKLEPRPTPSVKAYDASK